MAKQLSSFSEEYRGYVYHVQCFKPPYATWRKMDMRITVIDANRLEVVSTVLWNATEAEAIAWAELRINAEEANCNA
ncbi:MAG: hypothetical protein GY906_39015 [bacterium]|nr:hypothetical protein [bacterium]